MPPKVEAPVVTVVVSTRNPDARIVQTVDSILASDHPCFRLCLVDQSDRVAVRDLLGARLDDPRLHYLSGDRVGLSAGRNAGVRWASSSDVIAFTDDDCAVAPTWLSRITAPFAADPRIGIVFGTVTPAPHDPALGFLPSYTRATPFLGRSIFDKHHIEGMGASMAIRRSIWDALHGFDEHLGAGAPLRSAEETDFVIRALLAGVFAFETPDAVVVHAGFHPWAEAPRVLRDYLHGIGAALAKNLKRGHWEVLAVAGRLAWRFVAARPIIDLGAPAHRRARLFGFLSGARRGWRTPIVRDTGHFEPPMSAVPMRATPVEGVHERAPDRARAVPEGVTPIVEDRSPAVLLPSARPPRDERVSIVMPNWNAQPFLERALSSLVTRTTFPYELIVVDNGSTDGSKAYIRQFLREHPEVDSTFIDNPENLYFSSACNQGFGAASPDAKYLAVFCNDVEVKDERWLSELVEAIQPPDVVAAGAVGLEPVTDRQRGVFSTYDPVYPDASVAQRMRERLATPGATYRHLYGYCFLLKRELLQRTGLYLHTGPFRQYHSDWEWYLRFAAMGYGIAHVDIKVHHWNSISELLAFHPDQYRDLVERIADPATADRYIRGGRPLFEAESGFRSRFATPLARTLERLRRRIGIAAAP